MDSNRTAIAAMAVCLLLVAVCAFPAPGTKTRYVTQTTLRAYTAANRVALRNLTTLDARYAKRGDSVRFSRISATSISVPAGEAGNQYQMLQPIDHGFNSITFKPWSTLSQSVVFYFAADGLYRNISAGARVRKVLEW